MGMGPQVTSGWRGWVLHTLRQMRVVCLSCGRHAHMVGCTVGRVAVRVSACVRVCVKDCVVTMCVYTVAQITWWQVRECTSRNRAFHREFTVVKSA